MVAEDSVSAWTDCGHGPSSDWTSSKLVVDSDAFVIVHYRAGLHCECKYCCAWNPIVPTLQRENTGADAPASRIELRWGESLLFGYSRVFGVFS